MQCLGGLVRNSCMSANYMSVNVCIIFSVTTAFFRYKYYSDSRLRQIMPIFALAVVRPIEIV